MFRVRRARQVFTQNRRPWTEDTLIFPNLGVWTGVWLSQVLEWSKSSTLCPNYQALYSIKCTSSFPAVRFIEIALYPTPESLPTSTYKILYHHLQDEHRASLSPYSRYTGISPALSGMPG
jgi:hypothetical protein